MTKNAAELALEEASRALSERRFADAIPLAEAALVGPLDRNVPPSERGERYDLPERSLAHHILGTAHLELGDRKRAIAELDKALNADGTRWFSYSNRAIARRDEGDLEGALEDFGRALKRTSRYPHALYNRARLFVQLGRLADAEEDFVGILRSDPKAEPTRTEWAAVRETMGLAHDDPALAARLAERA